MSKDLMKRLLDKSLVNFMKKIFDESIDNSSSELLFESLDITSTIRHNSHNYTMGDVTWKQKLLFEIDEVDEKVNWKKEGF